MVRTRCSASLPVFAHSCTECRPDSCPPEVKPHPMKTIYTCRLYEVCMSSTLNKMDVQFERNEIWAGTMQYIVATAPSLVFIAIRVMHPYSSRLSKLSFKAKVDNFHPIPPTISHYWNPFIKFGWLITPNQNKGEDIGLFVFKRQLDNNKRWCFEGVRI